MVLEGLFSITKPALETETKLNRHLSAWRSRAGSGVKMELLKEATLKTPEPPLGGWMMKWRTVPPWTTPSGDRISETTATPKHFSESQNRD